jgi:hypothetical protein
MLTQLEAVHMGPGADLEGKDQLVAGAVERAHATIVFDPNDQVLQLRVDALPCRLHFGHVAPVHAQKVDRPVHAVIRHVAEGYMQEVGELGCRHLAGGHGELAVLHLASTRGSRVPAPSSSRPSRL